MGDYDDDFEEAGYSKIEFRDLTNQITLKPDHDKRPLWISVDRKDCKIILEAFSPLYKVATDFLIAIAEPVSRPKYFHEYMLTPFSLYAAVSVGLTKDDIFEVLDRLAKNSEIPQDVKQFIEYYSSQYGKAKLVLKDSRYFVEVKEKSTFEKLMEIDIVKQAYRECKQVRERERKALEE